jgi:hypothetical protein
MREDLGWKQEGWQSDLSVIDQCDFDETNSRNFRFGLFERMAATYSRGIYKTTTIGNAAFDGRVRNGNGSDHSFKATKKVKDQDTHSRVRSPNAVGISLKTTHRKQPGYNS